MTRKGYRIYNANGVCDEYTSDSDRLYRANAVNPEEVEPVKVADRPYPPTLGLNPLDQECVTVISQWQRLETVKDRSIVKTDQGVLRVFIPRGTRTDVLSRLDNEHHSLMISGNWAVYRKS